MRFFYPSAVGLLLLIAPTVLSGEGAHQPNELALNQEAGASTLGFWIRAAGVLNPGSPEHGPTVDPNG